MYITHFEELWLEATYPKWRVLNTVYVNDLSVPEGSWEDFVQANSCDCVLDCSCGEPFEPSSPCHEVTESRRDGLTSDEVIQLNRGLSCYRSEEGPEQCGDWHPNGSICVLGLGHQEQHHSPGVASWADSYGRHPSLGD